MDNISSVRSILDISTLLQLDNSTPEQQLCPYEQTDLQDVPTAEGQCVAGQSEGFAQHQVRFANPRIDSSYRLCHYGPASNEGQMNDCLNTVQESPVIRRSPLPAGLHSFNLRESKGNICCVNHNDSERRVTSHPPDYPTETSPADPLTSVVGTLALCTQNKVTKQLQKIARHHIVTTALRKKILSKKSGKSEGITGDAGNIFAPGSCEKISRRTAPLRKRVSTTSSVKSNRANEQHSFR